MLSLLRDRDKNRKMLTTNWVAVAQSTTGRLSEMRRSAIVKRVSHLLFGVQVGDTEKEQQNPYWRYQRRRNKLVEYSGLLHVGIPTVGVWWLSSNSIPFGIAVLFFFLVRHINEVLTTTSDAIVESLHERINLQSCWLEARLNAIESKLLYPEMETQGGTKEWEGLYSSPASDDSYYLDPETRPWRRYWHAQSRAQRPTGAE
jgi:hypothetical protein